MEQLWISKGRPGVYGTGQTNEYDVDFNGIELELTYADLDQLEEDILADALPLTEGFFFWRSEGQYVQARRFRAC
jgi:hypothetical protein